MKHNKQLESSVFYFFNEYEVRNKTQKIHKIVQIDFFIQNELTNQTKLLKIPDIKQHFYLCENTSQLQITHIDDDDRQIRHKYSKHDDTILLEFDDRKVLAEAIAGLR